MTPKKWSTSNADEVWKVLICARDVSRTRDTLEFMAHVLTDAGSATGRGLREIREMTGAQIVDALLDYRRVSEDSVRKAIGGRG